MNHFLDSSTLGSHAPAASPDTGDTADMAEHVRAFETYAAAYRTGNPDHDFHLDLKQAHSMNVFRYACRIAGAEDLFRNDADCARALRLAGLYHDFGRFEQYTRYGTFNDKLSINHGHISVREVKRTGVLDGESNRVRSLAMAGIILHNRFALPRGLTPDFLAVVKAVRDADKLDIMRVMAAHLTGKVVADPVVVLNVKPSPEVSQAVLAAVMERRLARYVDMATTTDFALLVCGWLYDLNFAWSRRMAARSEHLAELYASLPRTPELAVFFTQFDRDMAIHAA